MKIEIHYLSVKIVPLLTKILILLLIKMRLKEAASKDKEVYVSKYPISSINGKALSLYNYEWEKGNENVDKDEGEEAGALEDYPYHTQLVA